MSTRIERRQTRRHVRRARWSGIIAGVGATMLLGLGAAGALPGVTVKATPPETPTADAASATPGAASALTLPAQSVPTGAPGSVGDAASAAGATNADAHPTGAGQGAAISAAKSEDAGVASTGANAATSLGSESTETGTARAVLQVGNENAQTAIQTAIDRAAVAATAPAARPAVASARSTRAQASSTGRAWGALPRGTNLLTVSGCDGTGDTLKTGTPQVCTDIQGNLAVHFTVSPTGEALTHGSVSFTLPAGTSLASLTATASSEGTCSDAGVVTVNNGVVTISDVTCSQDTTYVWYFDATIGSTAGTYTLSGGYRTDDQPRNATNIFRLATDPTVTVV